MGYWYVGRPLLQSIARTNKPGLTVGSWHLGCLVSAILTIFIGDFLGRRRTLLLGITIWTIGEVVQASSYSFAQFIVGRGIAGFGRTHGIQFNMDDC